MATFDKLLLEWKEFHSNISHFYRGLRSTGDLSDVTLASEDGHAVPCHRLILCSASTHLQTIISSKEALTKPLVLQGISKKQLLSVLDFIYCGEVEVEKQDLSAFLDIGEKLQLKGLVKQNSPKTEQKLLRKETLQIKTEDEEEAAKILETNIYQCNTCGQKSDTKLCNHCQRKNIPNGTYDKRTNETLTPTVNDELEEKVNALIAKVDNVWRCLECDKVADNNRDHWNLKYHVESHISGIVHTCTICGHVSKTRSGRNKHNYKVHNNEFKKAQKIKRTENWKYKCKFCEQRSRSSGGLQQHMSKMHPTDKRLKSEGIYLNGKIESNLDKRRDVVGTCDVKEEHYLEKVIENVQQEVSTYVETTDDDRLKTSYLDNNIDPWNKNVSDESEVNRNAKIELQEKAVSLCNKEGEVWTCIKCGKQEDNVRRHNLFQHAERHIEDVVLTCEECGKEIRSSKGLYKHKTKNHSKAVGKYRCHLCQKIIKTKHGLSRHTNKYHLPEPEILVMQS